MASKPDNKSAANFKSDDSALIRELALLLDETSLTEIEIERAGLRVRVARNISIAASMPANFQQAAPAALTPLTGSVTPAAVADLAKHPGAVPSPMVGTAYWSPEPGAKPFIEVGTKVSVGADAADHRGDEDDEPDSLAARGHGDANSRRGRPAGRVRRAAGDH